MIVNDNDVRQWSMVKGDWLWSIMTMLLVMVHDRRWWLVVVNGDSKWLSIMEIDGEW